MTDFKKEILIKIFLKYEKPTDFESIQKYATKHRPSSPTELFPHKLKRILSGDKSSSPDIGKNTGSLSAKVSRTILRRASSDSNEVSLPVYPSNSLANPQDNNKGFVFF